MRIYISIYINILNKIFFMISNLFHFEYISYILIILMKIYIILISKKIIRNSFLSIYLFYKINIYYLIEFILLIYISLVI